MNRESTLGGDPRELAMNCVGMAAELALAPRLDPFAAHTLAQSALVMLGRYPPQAVAVARAEASQLLSNMSNYPAKWTSPEENDFTKLSEEQARVLREIHLTGKKYGLLPRWLIIRVLQVVLRGTPQAVDLWRALEHHWQMRNHTRHWRENDVIHPALWEAALTLIDKGALDEVRRESDCGETI